MDQNLEAVVQQLARLVEAVDRLADLTGLSANQNGSASKALRLAEAEAAEMRQLAEEAVEELAQSSINDTVIDFENRLTGTNAGMPFLEKFEHTLNALRAQEAYETAQADIEDIGGTWEDNDRVGKAEERARKLRREVLARYGS